MVLIDSEFRLRKIAPGSNNNVRSEIFFARSRKPTRWKKFGEISSFKKARDVRRWFIGILICQVRSLRCLWSLGLLATRGGWIVCSIRCYKKYHSNVTKVQTWKWTKIWAKGVWESNEIGQPFLTSNWFLTHCTEIPIDRMLTYCSPNHIHRKPGLVR